ncbi:hypothetical protein M3610_13495 [Neobacillus sp. MER 74]|uniref:hypothetical protein n=1 Tax=Neobacillus sp. MER 74 TaxID=2939566 RepID=UPI00203C2A8F|nr:hypothetical protein [Neobacillus sp. MER 74]MCM3116314.1 hypothetical protein [Neobacillus sp. MER 74]
MVNDLTEQEPITLEENVIDLNSFSSSKSNGINSRYVGAGVITIINSERNGKRIILSKELMEELLEPELVQIAFSSNEIAIGEEIPNNDHHFNVRKNGAKGVIYSAGLIQEITGLFNLDFSNKVSVTFYQVRYFTQGTSKVAIITVP